MKKFLSGCGTIETLAKSYKAGGKLNQRAVKLYDAITKAAI